MIFVTVVCIPTYNNGVLATRATHSRLAWHKIALGEIFPGRDTSASAYKVVTDWEVELTTHRKIPSFFVFVFRKAGQRDCAAFLVKAPLRRASETLPRATRVGLDSRALPSHQYSTPALSQEKSSVLVCCLLLYCVRRISQNYDLGNQSSRQRVRKEKGFQQWCGLGGNEGTGNATTHGRVGRPVLQQLHESVLEQQQRVGSPADAGHGPRSCVTCEFLFCFFCMARGARFDHDSTTVLV